MGCLRINRNRELRLVHRYRYRNARHVAYYMRYVALPASVFGEHYVARSEAFRSAVPDNYFDLPRKRDEVLTARRYMPIYVIASLVVPIHNACRVLHFAPLYRAFVHVHLLKVRLSIVAGVKSEKQVRAPFPSFGGIPQVVSA